MLIRVLAENTAVSGQYGYEHGLSLSIETGNHKLLFDTGASGLFVENARKMGIDLAAFDLAVISHGHNDHGGGLAFFFNMNMEAKIFINCKAFGKYYSKRPDGENVYIGLDQGLSTDKRFVFTEDRFVIDEDWELFSNVKGRKFFPSGNRNLLMKAGTFLLPDDFAHEQNLTIREGNNTVLLAGCAHNGIANILEHFQKEKGYWPSHVIGGFHLYHRSADRYEDAAVIRELGSYLLKTGAKFYTCHCTGIEPYHILKTVMKEKINYLSTGSQLII